MSNGGESPELLKEIKRFLRKGNIRLWEPPYTVDSGLESTPPRWDKLVGEIAVSVQIDVAVAGELLSKLRDSTLARKERKQTSFKTPALPPPEPAPEGATGEAELPFDVGEIERLGLGAADLVRIEKRWTALSTSLGYVESGVVVSLLTGAGLDIPTLKTIWELAQDDEVPNDAVLKPDGSLSKPEFYKACKLVALAQAGHNVHSTPLSTVTTAPDFEATLSASRIAPSEELPDSATVVAAEPSFTEDRPPGSSAETAVLGAEVAVDVDSAPLSAGQPHAAAGQSGDVGTSEVEPGSETNATGSAAPERQPSSPAVTRRRSGTGWNVVPEKVIKSKERKRSFFRRKKEQVSFENDAFFMNQDTVSGGGGSVGSNGQPLYFDQLPKNEQEAIILRNAALDEEEDQRQLRRTSTQPTDDAVAMDVPEGIRGWYRAPGDTSFERDDRAGLSIFEYKPRAVPAPAPAISEKPRKRGFSLSRKKRKPSESRPVQRRVQENPSGAPRQANSMLMTTEQRLAIMMMVRDGNMSIDEAATLVERKESVLQQTGAARTPEAKLGSAELTSESNAEKIVRAMKADVENAAPNPNRSAARPATTSAETVTEELAARHPTDSVLPDPDQATHAQFDIRGEATRDDLGSVKNIDKSTPGIRESSPKRPPPPSAKREEPPPKPTKKPQLPSHPPRQRSAPSVSSHQAVLMPVPNAPDDSILQSMPAKPPPPVPVKKTSSSSLRRDSSNNQVSPLKLMLQQRREKRLRRESKDRLSDASDVGSVTSVRSPSTSQIIDSGDELEDTSAQPAEAQASEARSDIDIQARVDEVGITGTNTEPDSTSCVAPSDDATPDGADNTSTNISIKKQASDAAPLQEDAESDAAAPTAKRRLSKAEEFRLKMGLSEPDCIAYRKLWLGSGRVGAMLSSKSAVRLFTQSGLPQQTLKLVWKLSDTAKPSGQLNEREFYVACKLIAIAQDGRAVDLASLPVTGLALPKFGGNVAKTEAVDTAV